MSLAKKISPSALLALKEALAAVYWYKNDLRAFLSASLSDSAVVATLNWSAVKREIAWEVVDRLSKNEANNQEILLWLMKHVSELSDFSHLLQLDDGEIKARRAKASVTALRTQIQGIDALLNDRADVEAKRREYEVAQKRVTGTSQALEELKRSYMSLVVSTDPHNRGYELEKLLGRLFEIFDLDPKASFRVVGEQIDGAFTFENTDYLLEAKWQKEPIGVKDLDSLQSKVSRKLENTLGLYISINGFSQDGLAAFLRNRPNIYLCDGADLMAVLEARIGLKELLMRKRREASQTGNIYLPVSEVLSA